MLLKFRLHTTAAAVLAAFALPVLAADQPEAATQLSVVEVTATPDVNGMLNSYRTPVTSNGALGKKEVLDTPFSISTATSAYIANQQATTLAEAFKADAAVTAITNNISGENSQIAIRGLQLDMLNGFKINGLNSALWITDLPLEHFASIDLLKGLSGFMYGFSQPGGIANYNLKRATPESVSSASITWSNESQYKIAADLGRRFGEEDRYGLRVNAVHEGGDTYLDSPIHRDSISAAFDVNVTENVHWNVDALYQKRKVNNSMFALVVDTGVPTPQAVDGAEKLTQDFTYYKTELATAGTDVTIALNNDWSVQAGVRGAQMKRTNYDSYLDVFDAEGNYSEDLIGWYSEHKSVSANLILSGKVQTGSIKHDLTFGTDYQQVKRTGATDLYIPMTTGNLYTGRGIADDPQETIPQDLRQIWSTRSLGVFASDTIEWSPQWSAIVGLRYNDYHKETVSATYDRSPVTPTVALIWKPQDALSIYASYVEAMEEGGVAPLGTVNEDDTFAPLMSKQFELGVKKVGSGWSTEAALFRVERGLEYTNSANVFVQEGGLIYQGLDIGGRVELGSSLALMGSAVLMQSKNKSDDPSVNGKKAKGTPGFTTSLQAEYKLLGVKGLTLTGSGRYVGETALEDDNSHMIDAYTLFDLGVRYQTQVGKQNMILRANIDNLTNEKYWVGSWGYSLTQGAPRTARVSAEINF